MALSALVKLPNGPVEAVIASGGRAFVLIKGKLIEIDAQGRAV